MLGVLRSGSGGRTCAIVGAGWAADIVADLAERTAGSGPLGILSVARRGAGGADGLERAGAGRCGSVWLWGLILVEVEQVGLRIGGVLPGRGYGRWCGREAEVVEDLLDDFCFRDEGDDEHLCVATWAVDSVHAEGALEEARPGQAPGSGLGGVDGLEGERGLGLGLRVVVVVGVRCGELRGGVFIGWWWWWWRESLSEAGAIGKTAVITVMESSP